MHSRTYIQQDRCVDQQLGKATESRSTKPPKVPGIRNRVADRDTCQRLTKPSARHQTPSTTLHPHPHKNSPLHSTMASRVTQVAAQLGLTGGKSKLLVQSDNDVVIVSALRTAVTKVRRKCICSKSPTKRILQAKKGGFKDTHPEELLSNVLRAVYTQAKLDPSLIEDIAVGNVLPPGGGATAARMAALHAGIPNTAAINTLNRQCSSGLAAVNQIANQISTGQIDIGIG